MFNETSLLAWKTMSGNKFEHICYSSKQTSCAHLIHSKNSNLRFSYSWFHTKALKWNSLRTYVLYNFTWAFFTFRSQYVSIPHIISEALTTLLTWYSSFVHDFEHLSCFKGKFTHYSTSCGFDNFSSSTVTKQAIKLL